MFAVLATLLCAAALEPVPGQGPIGDVEIHGVSAGAFDAAMWEANTLHFVADRRYPLLTPREEGAFRNIYAPSAVQTADGWRLFYGAWDGVDTGNDRIYSTATTNWLTFGPRSTVIEHGPFIHVCNVNAVAGVNGGFDMVCTAYPDADGLNKPAWFSSPDGDTWNGSPQPYSATLKDTLDIVGYPPYKDADINGVNVIVRDGDQLVLYFNDFKNFGHVFRATQAAGRRFDYTGVALDASMMVNDVKIFGDTRLMGLHHNGEALYYALSNDGKTFSEPQRLLDHRDDADRYIVALGWVVDNDRLLGVLYGAGAVPGLNRNRIFARWLQKKVVFESGGVNYEPRDAMGPDRQYLTLPQESMTGTLTVYAPDGATVLETTPDVTLRTGHVYTLNND